MTTKEMVLVVDDSEELLHLIDMMLKPLYHVIKARDGDLGLMMVEQYDPDLIILDMNMPRVTGIEMLMTLRKAGYERPVIFMTAEGSEVIAVQVFRLGVSDYLVKPFSHRQLRAAIDSALRQTRLERENKALERSLIEAEATRNAVVALSVTMSHYINNQLMITAGGLSLLEEWMRTELHLPQDSEWFTTIDSTQTSVQKIEAVLRVLQKIEASDLTTYHGDVHMLNIEAALQKELQGL